MAHFFRPSDAPSHANYDVDGKLALDSLWRVRAPFGLPVAVGVYGAAGANLWIKSNNPNIVNSDNPNEWVIRNVGIDKIASFSGKMIGTTIIYAGSGEDTWISIQFQSTPSDGVMPTISDPSKYYVSKADPSSLAGRGAKTSNGRLWRQELELGGRADVGITGLTSWDTVKLVFNNPAIASAMKLTALGENLAGPDGIRLVFQISGTASGNAELIAYESGRPFAAMQVSVTASVSKEAAYVDDFQDFAYDPDYNAEGGNRSTTMAIRYHDDVVIPINYLAISDGLLMPSNQKRSIGPGGRLYPTVLNAVTTPKLYAAKRQTQEIIWVLLYDDVRKELLNATTQIAFYVSMFEIAGVAQGAFKIVGKSGVRGLMREVINLPAALRAFFTKGAAKEVVVEAVKGPLSKAQMKQFLQAVWSRNPILRRIAQAEKMSGEAQQRELINILSQFERETGIAVQRVPTGGVQAVRGSGNLASLRSRPGVLQIEEQVFQDTPTLMKEIKHELAYHFTGGPGGVPSLGQGPLKAMDLLEMMISEGPEAVLEGILK